MFDSTREDRRAFLRRLKNVLAGGAAATLFSQLELVGRAMAADTPLPSNDYKALVCIFLAGGNDSFNMLIPWESAEYAAYEASRDGVYDKTTNPGGLAIRREDLAQIIDANGKTWGLHPQFGGVAPLFSQGDLAFLANIGSLAVPVTKAEVTSKDKPLPSDLYSHNDQQRQWLTGASSRSATTGWGGRLADLVDRSSVALGALPPAISLSGSTMFLHGATSVPYAMASGGPAALSHFAGTSAADRARLDALRALVNHPYESLLGDQYAATGKNALALNEALLEALLPDNGGDVSAVFPEGSLGQQLRMIARMIKVSQTPAIGHQRQLYFALLGGFDTHQNQMVDAGHGALLKQLGDGLAAFREALIETGSLDKVMTFTMSDFSRTLNSNGKGSDHAWGGVQLVMGKSSVGTGGRLAGQRVHGDYPLLELDGAQSVGRGRMIPTTAVMQLGATLAQWFGAPADSLETIFPGIGNFATARLPFLT